MKKIYFAGSIRGGRADAELYFKIIILLEKYGQVLTEHVGLKSIKAMGEQGRTEAYIYERDCNWLKEAEIVIAEVTMPSTGVGYELAYAEALGKLVYCLYRPGPERSLSAMVRGNKNFRVFDYNDVKDVEDILKQIFN